MRVASTGEFSSFGLLHARVGGRMCQSVCAYLLDVTGAVFCETLGALGAHPRADEPYAVLGECQQVPSRCPRAADARREGPTGA
jgi:hypothetical protein